MNSKRVLRANNGDWTKIVSYYYLITIYRELNVTIYRVLILERELNVIIGKFSLNY